MSSNGEGNDSDGDSQGGAGRREVAWRVFAAEYDDSDFDYSESDEERAPNYVVTPTGARINRLFVVGVLTEVERVSDDVLRGRVVDPTGAFVLYAGQYQPDEMAFLENADPPAFVAVTGKARTFQPDDSDRVFTSIRPESINRVDADTRDRWVVQTAEQTLARVSTFADAIDSGERGDALRNALETDGADSGLAAGIPLALDHYGTTTAYLADVWDLALDSARVVAGELSADEVGPLELAPGEGGDETDVDLDYSLTDGEAGEADLDTATADPSDETETADDSDTAEPTDSASETDLGDAPESETTAESDGDEEGPDIGTAGAGDEMYEFDDEEREEVEAEYGLEFSSGSEVDSPEESDLDAPDPETGLDSDPDSGSDSAAGDDLGDFGGVSDADAADATDEGGAGAADETPAETADTDSTDDGEQEAPANLEDTVMDEMRELNDGDGVERDTLLAAVVQEYDVTPADVEDALEAALMAGRCYESGEETLKPI
ncbi:hypothetical protein [Halorussus pelagicus]|uniref:hypothetical protein n=1 Tax=Halorussus pelagicus TaxID=2505977 RepID=UPI000FFC94AE|nr:hypothetical protein [Halorussus pelagicus]